MKKIGIVMGACALFLAGGFGAGFSCGRKAPIASQQIARTSTESKAEAKKDTATESKAETQTVKQDQNQAQNTWKRKTNYNCPDGRVSSVEEEGTRNEASSSSVATNTKSENKAKTSEASKSENKASSETIKTVYAPAPKWIFTLGAGASVPALLGSQPHAPQLIPGVPEQLILSASINRQLFGPVYGGLWATSTGAVGLGVTVGF